MSKVDSAYSLRVIAPARLHLGFYNLKSENVEFGSLGLSVDSPAYNIAFSSSDEIECTGLCLDSVRSVVESAVEKLNVPGVKLCIEEVIPSHVGFGSTTQLTLSVYYGISKVYNLNLELDYLAKISGRGLISRVGVEAFKKGGFIVDSGRVNGNPPSLLLRVPFPKSWRIITVTPSTKRGFSEAEESLEVLLPESPSKTLQCKLVKTAFLGVIPGVLSRDFNLYVSSLEKLQNLIGKYYSKVQGGVFSSQESLYAASKLRKVGGRGVGQSSWGPTVYGFFENPEKALKSWKLLIKEFREEGFKAEVRVLKGRNRGAKAYQSTS